jgi:N,N'-diacetylchitobiose transport system permease protein
VSGRRTGRLGWNVVGIVIFVVMVFPVFWMVTTSFKANHQIYGFNPTWFPRHPTLRHF